MFIIKHKWIFLSFSILLVSASLVLIFTKGIKKGIDFTGGTEVLVSYTGEIKPDLEVIKTNLSEKGFVIKDLHLQKESSNNEEVVSIRLVGEVGPENRADFDKSWNYGEGENLHAQQISENVIGPSIGKELTRKAFSSVTLVTIVIILFVAFSFREVSKPVASWKYGVITVGALLHDISIPLGMYVILGITHGAEINSLFVLALLTIMSISMSDTIVVFDRVRENLRKRKSTESFSEIVGKSLDQTLLRSFNTSLAVLLVLSALYFFGPISIHDFALTLIVGMTVGVYSSIFVASPLLVLVEKWQKKNN